MERTRPRVFYGWWIVAASFLVMMLHAGAAFYAYGRFMPTLIDELHASTAAVSFAVSIYLLLLGLTGPVAGKLTEKYGPKRIILWGGIIAGAGLMLLGLTNALWHLYVFYFIVGIGMSGAGTVPVSVVIANWFNKRRGIAIGITMAGVAVGAIAIAPLAHYLIQGIGWRMAYLVLGVLTIIFVVVPVVFTMKTRPQDIGLLPDGESHANSGTTPGQASSAVIDTKADTEPVWSASQALKTTTLWLVLIAFFLAGAGVSGILQHEVRILQIMGVPMAAASVALGLTGLIGGGGKLGFGFLCDKMSPKYTAIICVVIQLIGVIILMFTHTMSMVWLFVIVYGFAMGGWLTLEPLVTADFFGARSIATVFGWVLAAAAVGSSVGPIIMGAIYDASGSYSIGLLVFIGAYIIATVALLIARKPKPSVHSTIT